MKRNVLLIIMLLMVCMLLTGCYKEVDPWPASLPAVSEQPPTALPTAEATVAPTAVPVAVTLAPFATSEPMPEPPEDDFWADEQPTQTPGGDAAPGFNG